MEAPFPGRFPYLPGLDGAWLRLLLAAMVLIASAALVSGTAATLNSTTVNPASGFAAGRLILSNHVRDRNPCLSQGPRVSCEALFPGVLTPGVPASAQVTISNLGTIPVASLSLWSTACRDGSSAASAQGTAGLCANTWLTVHDDDHDRCYFPVEAPGPCATTPRRTFSDFVTQHGEKNPVALSTDHLGGGNAYTFTATIDPSLGNDAQGRVADITLIWEIVQA
ncbi:MAG TPA: hypothetical protein VIN56_08490 [Candidatus Dormibacteraeota bacterium]|jgi:hypothetical protein